MLACYRR